MHIHTPCLHSMHCWGFNQCERAFSCHQVTHAASRGFCFVGEAACGHGTHRRPARSARVNTERKGFFIGLVNPCKWKPCSWDGCTPSRDSWDAFYGQGLHHYNCLGRSSFSLHSICHVFNPTPRMFAEMYPKEKCCVSTSVAMLQGVEAFPSLCLPFWVCPCA